MRRLPVHLLGDGEKLPVKLPPAVGQRQNAAAAVAVAGLAAHQPLLLQPAHDAAGGGGLYHQVLLQHPLVHLALRLL